MHPHPDITVDYFSNFSEVDHLTTTTATQVINKVRSHFTRYGIPDTVVSDNGPQFSGSQFAAFAQQWQFTRVTSSPRYPQSMNGKTESTVKTAKLIMKKALEAKCDVYLALLDFRNTHSEYLHSSPAQRMFGRPTRTLLPLSPSLLQPEPARQTTALKQLCKAKDKQAQQYNRTSKSLSQMLPGGNVVRMKPPSGTYGRSADRWTRLARIIKSMGPRSTRSSVKVQRFAGIAASCALHRISTRPHLSRRSSTTKSKEAHNLRHRLVTQLTIRSYVSHARHKLQYSIFLPQSIMLQTKPYQLKQQ